MYLYLVRHAIAFEPDPAQWPDDRDRPLTPEGEKRFRQAALGLRELVPSVDAVLSSPLVRAWQTAAILARKAGWPEPQRFDALEPGTPPPVMRKGGVACLEFDNAPRAGGGRLDWMVRPRILRQL